MGRWFKDFWGKTCDPGVVDEFAAPDMLLVYSLHKSRRGRADIKAFMSIFAKPGIASATRESWTLSADQRALIVLYPRDSVQEADIAATYPSASKR